MRERDGRPASAVAAWAASGMLALTGRPDGTPLGPPGPLVDGAMAIADELATLTERLGSRVDVDPFALMAERAALAGLTRRGTVSCGGATRLIPSADGWVAVSLARPTDWELVAALLDLAGPVPPDHWEVLEDGVAARSSAHLRERATLLGLPLGVLGERSTAQVGSTPTPNGGIIRRRGVRRAEPGRSLEGLVVVDLSSLWAGPLAGALLASAGAEVVKVESTTRPDGARWGPPAFFDRLNGDKASVAVDLGTAQGRARLRHLVDAAEVVITSARPRALDQLGLDPVSLMSAGGPKVWLMISGYGHGPEDRARVAFGDDAAVAGGLVSWDGLGPCFCGDAVADPLSGLAGAVAVLAALEDRGVWILEASMADIAGGLAGPTLQVAGLPAPGPVASTVDINPAPGLGTDTGRILHTLGGE